MKRRNWDRTESEHTIAFRCMLYEPVREVLKKYDREYLKKIYFDKFWEFDKRNRNFWKFVLGIKDEEIEKLKRTTKAGIRGACKIWDY